MTQFTDDERARIESEMIDTGHDLFAQFGFDRTRVSDVTDAVDIGTSTFYQFFDSKEELYFAVLIAEREQLFEELEEAISETETPQAEAEIILRTTLEQVRSNALIRRLFVDGEIRRIEERMNGTKYDQDSTISDNQAGKTKHDHGEDPIEVRKKTDYRQALSEPEEWVNNDDVHISDPDIIRGLFRSLLFVTQAKETPVVPEESYEKIEETLVNTVVAGLFADKDALEDTAES